MPKKIQVYPGTGGGGGGSAAGTSSGSAARTSSGGSGGGGGGGGSSISGAERRANAKENSAKRKAAAKYRDQVKTLEEQAQALNASLGSGFRDALRKRLANADLVFKQGEKTLMEGYASRVGDLKGAESDNRKAFNDTSFASLANRARERMSAVNEAMSQGAGESDVLKSQIMSLRSWDSNQGEANRSFFDTLRSVNSSLGDLNADTKTARVNAASQLNNDKDQLWTQYFNQKSEAYTQLGNLRGQQAELYGMAAEQANGKKNKRDQKKSTKASGSAFDSAADYATRVKTNPGVDKTIRDWQGSADFAGQANNSLFENAATNIAPAKKPEGATLRKW